MSSAFTILKNRLFNPQSIYQENGGYNYPLPLKRVDQSLRGTVDGDFDGYTESELDNLRNDITNLAIDILKDNPEVGSSIYLAVGAPGAGKSILLRQFQEHLVQVGRKIIHLDPYEVCLPKLTTTFQADLEASDGSFESKKAVYQKWRPAAQGAYHLLTAWLMYEKFSILLCSKSSIVSFEEHFDFYHEQGYNVSLLHLTAPDDLRLETIEKPSLLYKDVERISADARASRVFRLLAKTYLEKADSISFYYRHDAEQDPVIAAKITFKGVTNFNIRLLDAEAYNKIALIHDAHIEAETYPEEGFRNLIANRAVKLLPKYRF